MTTGQNPRIQRLTCAAGVRDLEWQQNFTGHRASSAVKHLLYRHTHTRSGVAPFVLSPNIPRQKLLGLSSAWRVGRPPDARDHPCQERVSTAGGAYTRSTSAPFTKSGGCGATPKNVKRAGMAPRTPECTELCSMTSAYPAIQVAGFSTKKNEALPTSALTPCLLVQLHQTVIYARAYGMCRHRRIVENRRQNSPKTNRSFGCRTRQRRRRVCLSTGSTSVGTQQSATLCFDMDARIPDTPLSALRGRTLVVYRTRSLKAHPRVRYRFYRWLNLF